MPKKINNLIIEGKELEKEWSINKLSKTLYKNIKFENNINIIKLEKEKLKNILSSHNKNIIFIAGNKKFDELANNIKLFGKIDVKKFKVIDTFKEMKLM